MKEHSYFANIMFDPHWEPTTVTLSKTKLRLKAS